MSLPKNNHILRTPTKKNTNNKKPKKIRTTLGQNHEIPKSKIGERETKESKKQKRERIQNKWRVPSARWATNGVENELRLLERLPSSQWLWICFRLGPRICFMNEWVSEWESKSEFERAERNGVSTRLCVWTSLVCNEPLKEGMWYI